ncbi:hypothetical protein [Lutibacter sp.]|nr:hypothetical protein [Lutibacter sp.]
MKNNTTTKVFKESWLYVLLTVALGTLVITLTPYVAINLTLEN